MSLKDSIKKYAKTSLSSLFFRGLSMGAKFILMILLGKYLPDSDLGLYGLFQTTIILAVYALGMDFYTFQTREIIAAPEKERGAMVRDQFIFYGLTYALMLPLLVLVFFFNVLPFQYILYFYLVLVFEHLGQEFFRLFTALSKPVIANVILFLRMGSWVYIIIAMWLLGMDSAKTLPAVWLAWFAGGLLSVVVSVIYLGKLGLGDFFGRKIDFKWMFRGLKVSLRFLISTVANQVIGYANRYMIDFFLTKGDLGVYTFFNSIANLIQVIVYTIITMIYYPKIVEHCQKENYVEAGKVVREFFVFSMGISVLLGGGVMLFIHPVLNFVGKESFASQVNVLLYLILAYTASNFANVPHYVLYAHHKDRFLLYSTLVGAAVSLILNYFFISAWGIAGAALAVLLGYLLIALIKSGYLLLHPQQYGYVFQIKQKP